MKLNDLKQGMVCKIRNKESFTVANSGYCLTNVLIRFTLEEKYNEDLTHKENKNLDVMKITYGDKVVFERKESRWFVPEVGERYYFSDNIGGVVSKKYIQDTIDENIFNTVKVFKTKEEVEKRLKQQKATLSVERWIAENDVEVDVCDSNVEKYFIAYSVVAKKFITDSYIGYIVAPKQFILSSEAIAERLIEEREKELELMLGAE